MTGVLIGVVLAGFWAGLAVGVSCGWYLRSEGEYRFRNQTDPGPGKAGS